MDKKKHGRAPSPDTKPARRYHSTLTSACKQSSMSHLSLTNTGVLGYSRGIVDVANVDCGFKLCLATQNVVLSQYRLKRCDVLFSSSHWISLRFWNL